MSKQQTAQQNIQAAGERKALLAMEHKAVGEEIARLMASVNWSSADLCRHTDLNSGNLSKVLKGERGISAYNLMMVQQAVREEQEIRRHRASFRDERGEAIRKKVLPQMSEMMTHDGLSPDRVDGVCESITGIIKSAYAP